MVQLVQFDKAINLARRYTEQNENDLMQESLYDDEPHEDPLFRNRTYSEQFCKELSMHLLNTKNLPPQCQKYRNVVKDLKRRETDRSSGDDILS